MGRIATLEEVMAVPPPVRKAVLSQNNPGVAPGMSPDSQSSPGTPRMATLEEVMAVPPPPPSQEQMDDEADDDYARKTADVTTPEFKHETDKSYQAFKAGASENLADLTRILSKVGFSAVLTQKAREIADKENEKYEDMDPNIHQNLAKAVAEYGLAAMESAAAVSGAGEVLSALGGAAESFGVLAQLAAKAPKTTEFVTKVAKGGKALANKNAATRFATQVGKEIPGGAAFGALTTDEDEDLSTGALIGAAGVPAGVGIGKLLSKILGHISETTAKKELASQATKPIEEMEQVLKDNPDKSSPIMLGDAIGSPTTKKLELNELPERASYGPKAMKKLDTISENLTNQANTLGDQLEVNKKTSRHALSIDLSEKIKAHSDNVNKQKRELFKASDEAAKNANFQVELPNLRRAAQENKDDIEKIFEETGIGGPADQSLKILNSILEKTDAKVRKGAQRTKVDDLNTAASEAFNFLDQSSKELMDKLGEVTGAQKDLQAAKEKWADAEEALPKDVYGNKGASRRVEEAERNHKEALKNLERKKGEFQDLAAKRMPEMAQVREHLDNIVNIGNKELKKLLEMPDVHKIDLKTADLAKHSLNLKYADADAADNSDLKRIYSILLKGLNEDIDSAIEAAPKSVKSAHDKAMKFYKDKVVPLFQKDIHKVVKGDIDPDKVRNTFLPMTKSGRYYVTQLNSLIDHVPGTAKPLLQHALMGSLDKTKRGVKYINPSKLNDVLNTIGEERLGPLLEKAGLKAPKEDVLKEVKRFDNNMENGQGVFNRMDNPPTGQRNTAPIMKGVFFQYISDIFDHIGNRDLTGLLERAAYTGRKYAQFHAINDSRQTLEDIIKLKKGLKIKTTLYHKLSQMPKHAGKPTGLFATALLNDEDDD